MARGWTLSELREMSAADLDSLYERASPPAAVPVGVHRGHHLRWIDHPTSVRPLWRWSERLGFAWAPFGIDFDRRLWFFFRPELAVGRFEPRIHRSRWRDTDAVGLHYDRSRLPGWLRGWLYDEVQPLSERWMLGIGGIAGDRNVGDHFYFALERRPAAAPEVANEARRS